MERYEDVVLNAPYIQRRVQVAIERVTEDPGLTEALADTEALILLNWAETEIERLVLETADMDNEEAWEQLNPALRTLRRFIRRAATLSADTVDPAAMVHLLLASPPAYIEET